MARPLVRRTRTIAVFAATLASATLLAASETEPATFAAPVNDQLSNHHAVLDARGRLLPWARGTDGQAYDRLLRSSWRFLERRVPRDRRWGTGLPVYLIDAVYDGNTLQSAYWQHNPASLYGQFVDAVLPWYAYSGDRQSVEVVRGMLDYQLVHGTTPADWEWPGVPFATACSGDRDYGRCLAGMPRGFRGGVETDKVGELGVGYAQFYELTGDRRYLDAAVAAGDALARHVRAGDAWHTPWPFRVDGRTGAVLAREEYGGMIVSPVRLFDELIELGAGDTPQYRRARDVAWGWLLRHPLNRRSPAWRKWSGYYEDVERDTDNLNQAAPTMTAWYLLTHPAPETIDPAWREHVNDLIEWVRGYFGRGPYYGAWAIDEQHPPNGGHCCSSAGVGSATARWAAINALQAERIGRSTAPERALRSLNYATYFAETDGKVACCGSDFRFPYWFDDGYSDYMRSFHWAMGALPRLAPRGQDHLLRSTSVIQAVRYARWAVTYQAFADGGTEVLRLSYRPATVTADGSQLPRRSRLDGPGYTTQRLGGGDVILRVRRDGARSVAIAGPAV
ncbi:MAG: hypothetical protein M3155_00095 [Actinomycetota bacterium]|nr:hypothetical protein [Actinomycetota bacterium]